MLLRVRNTHIIVWSIVCFAKRDEETHSSDATGLNARGKEKKIYLKKSRGERGVSKKKKRRKRVWYCYRSGANELNERDRWGKSGRLCRESGCFRPPRERVLSSRVARLSRLSRDNRGRGIEKSSWRLLSSGWPFVEDRRLQWTGCRGERALGFTGGRRHEDEHEPPGAGAQAPGRRRWHRCHKGHRAAFSRSAEQHTEKTSLLDLRVSRLIQTRF